MFAAGANERWRPGIGDPTVMGWVTVAAYLIAALGCFRAAWREPDADGHQRRRPAPFWLALAISMVALAINKQLDLQSLLTQIGRDVIRSLGLGEQRRFLQGSFILFVALTCAAILAGCVYASRRMPRRRLPAIVGILFILGFVVIRSASFHHVDAFLAARLGGVKWNWILELGGIGILGLAAIRAARADPSRPRS
jgi:hypothetical protein